MRIRHQALVVCIAAFCLALLQAGSASAAGCQTLPGRSGVDQYCETLPGATGDQTPGARGGGGGGSGLPAATQAQLRRGGQAGQEIAALVATGPRKHGSEAGGGSGQGGPNGPSTAATRTGTSTGASVGSGLIWALAAAAALVAGLAVLRQRLRRSS